MHEVTNDAIQTVSEVNNENNCFEYYFEQFDWHFSL